MAPRPRVAQWASYAVLLSVFWLLLGLALYAISPTAWLYWIAW